MIQLRAVERKRGGGRSTGFPFTVPAIASLERLDLAAPVTFFVGENGSGKSTMLEAIAAAARLPAVGSSEIGDDATLALQRRLAGALKLVWTERTHRGFFMRAEDFFGFGRRVAKMRVDLDERLGEVDQEFKDPYSRGLAAGPTHASLGALTERYGSDLDARSHGEGFLKLFEARLVPRGLYLMDEPEAALSPQNQLVLLALLKEMIAQESQFIIA